MTATAAILRETFAVLGADTLVSSIRPGVRPPLMKLAAHPKLPVAMAAAGLAECRFNRRFCFVADVLGAFLQGLERVESYSQVTSALRQFAEEDLRATLRTVPSQHIAIDIALVGMEGAEIGRIEVSADDCWTTNETTKGALLGGPKPIMAFKASLSPSEFRLEGVDTPNDVEVALRARLAKCIELDPRQIGWPVDIAVVDGSGVRVRRFSE